MGWKTFAMPLIAVVSLLSLAAACGNDEDIFEDILDELGITPTAPGDVAPTPDPGDGPTPVGPTATPVDVESFGSAEMSFGGETYQFVVTECSPERDGFSEMLGLGETENFRLQLGWIFDPEGSVLDVRVDSPSDALRTEPEMRWTDVEVSIGDDTFEISGSGLLSQGFRDGQIVSPAEEVPATVSASCGPR